MSENTEQQKRRKPLGTARPLTDADLDRLAEVTEQDLQDAAAWVDNHASLAGVSLWNAKGGA